MSHLYFISHPDVKIDPTVPIRSWGLNDRGRARTQQLVQQPWLSEIAALFSSTEQKAIETANILSDELHIPSTAWAELSEIDRDATGYLPLTEFEKVVSDFFAHPSQSIRGWETAAQAQARIVAALEKIIEENTARTVAVVSHGGVGALALAHFVQEPISQTFDQPGNGGGNYFVLDMTTREIIQSWHSIDEPRL